MSESDRTVVLHTWTAAGLALTEALAAALPVLGEGAIGLLYDPAACRLVRSDGSALCDVHDQVLDTDACFEARVFSQAGELRWWHDAAVGRGRAAYLSEVDSGPDNWAHETTAALQPIATHYLLWGEASADVLGPRWSRLTTERIGELLVPLGSLAARVRVRLRAFEYIGEAPGDAGGVHGNHAILAERLVQLEPYEHGRHERASGAPREGWHRDAGGADPARPARRAHANEPRG